MNNYRADERIKRVKSHEITRGNRNRANERSEEKKKDFGDLAIKNGRGVVTLRSQLGSVDMVTCSRGSGLQFPRPANFGLEFWRDRMNN
jgi:hypothetical protein